METFAAARGAGIVALIGVCGCDGATQLAEPERTLVMDAGGASGSGRGDAGANDMPREDAQVISADARAGDAGNANARACNGHVELCARRYDEVVFAATHNAHSAEEYGYSALNANQLSGFAKQLKDGVRAFLMDVYDDGGDHVFCHGPCALGKTSHLDGLTIFADFLAAHPREVLTFIYQDDLAAGKIAADFVASGLDAYVFTHEAGSPWPTLETLIAQNTRLVVTAENGRPPPAWFHHVWEVAWDTPYEFKSAGDFSCTLNRGSRDNDLFLVNHWLGDALGLPSKSGAMQVNAYEVLYGRVRGCWDETGDVPNFVAVDFYEYGDLLQVVDALNSEGG